MTPGVENGGVTVKVTVPSPTLSTLREVILAPLAVVETFQWQSSGVTSTEKLAFPPEAGRNACNGDPTTLHRGFSWSTMWTADPPSELVITIRADRNSGVLFPGTL
jgi:hypothetical protein